MMNAFYESAVLRLQRLGFKVELRDGSCCVTNDKGVLHFTETDPEDLNGDGVAAWLNVVADHECSLNSATEDRERDRRSAWLQTVHVVLPLPGMTLSNAMYTADQILQAYDRKFDMDRVTR